MTQSHEIHFEPETPSPNVDSLCIQIRQRSKVIIDQRNRPAQGVVPHLLYFQNSQIVVPNNYFSSSKRVILNIQ